MRTVVGIIELLVLLVLAVVVAMLCQRVTRIERKINIIGSQIAVCIAECATKEEP